MVVLSRAPARAATVATLVLLAAVAALVAVAAAAGEARAQGVLTQQEALRMAFPEPAEIERRTAFLDGEQLGEARQRAGGSVEIESEIVTYYVAREGDRALGAAYFDAHRVRTLQEVVMIVVDPAGAVDRVEILKFSEPPEYRAPDGWIEQFEGRILEPALSTRGDIANITGATLTARALTRAVRKILALHGVIEPFEPAGEGGA
jgi:Na+-translocating ferredoxin:NAD+ oxidoreductase RnfG subunit